MLRERVILTSGLLCVGVVAAVGGWLLTTQNQEQAGGTSGQSEPVVGNPEQVRASEAAADAAREYLLNGEVSKAVLLLERAIEVTPGLQVLHLVASDAYFDRDDLSRAAEAMERAIEIGPAHGEMYQAAGLYRSMLGERLVAIEHWREAQLLLPGDPRFGLQTAAVLHGLGLYEDAIQEAQKLLDEHPQVAQAHAISAGASIELSRFEEALQAAQSATRLEPANWTYRLLEAQAMIGLDDPLGAVSALRALPRDVLLGDVLLTRTYASALAEIERIGEAVGILLAATSIDVDGALREQAAMLLIGIGDHDGALVIADDLRLEHADRSQSIRDSIRARKQ